MEGVDLSALLPEFLLASDESGDMVTVPAASVRGKVVGVYFSAHWCPPCRQFTPLLARVYNKLKAQGKDFEVVFVTSDREKHQFEEYFQTMPWKAVPFEDTAARRRLSSQFAVRGIPTLVIIGADGRVLTLNGRAAVSRDPSGQGFPWEGAKGDGIFGNPILVLLLFVACWKFAQWVLGLWKG